MPHGDFSDLAALTLIAGGFQQIFKPELSFSALTSGVLDDSFDTQTPEVTALIKLLGGFMLIVGCMLTTVRWNTINGKLSGLACIGCAVNIGFVVFKGLDKEVFIARPLYVYMAVLILGGLHLMFNANPMIKAQKPKAN